MTRAHYFPSGAVIAKERHHLCVLRCRHVLRGAPPRLLCGPRTCPGLSVCVFRRRLWADGLHCFFGLTIHEAVWMASRAHAVILMSTEVGSPPLKGQFCCCWCSALTSSADEAVMNEHCAALKRTQRGKLRARPQRRRGWGEGARRVRGEHLKPTPSGDTSPLSIQGCWFFPGCTLKMGRTQNDVQPPALSGPFTAWDCERCPEAWGPATLQEAGGHGLERPAFLLCCNLVSAFPRTELKARTMGRTLALFCHWAASASGLGVHGSCQKGPLGRILDF